MGKEREGFTDWMCDNNIFSIETDLTISRELRQQIIRENTVLLYIDLAPQRKDLIKSQFDSQKVMRII